MTGTPTILITGATDGLDAPSPATWPPTGHG